MSLTIKISGVYNNPQAQPLPGVTLEFESRANSSQTQMQITVSTTTGDDASYSIYLVPNAYSVCELYGKNRRKWLGNIQIYPDSVPGTLNEYLTSFKPDQMQPGILAEMEEILEETKRVAADAGVIPCGAWDPSTEYVENDLVQYEGSQFRATTDVTGVEPPTKPWELFVAAGGNGPPNSLEIGRVETLPAGQSATAEITGDAPNQTLNLSIPAGGSGSPGPANILQVGTVETLAPGEQATAEITGDTPNQVLNLGIPEGGEGKPGPAGSVTSVSGITPDASGAVQITGSTGRFLNPNTPTTYTPTMEFLIETAYIHLDSADFTVDLTGIEAALNAKTLVEGYTVRIVIGTNNAARTVTFQTNGYLNWIDGSVKKSPVMTISRSYTYLFQIMAVAGAPLFVVQLSPAV